jgi:putative adhesin
MRVRNREADPAARTALRALVLAAAAIVPSAVALSSESTRTLRAELSGPEIRNFSIENLAGTMRILAAPEGSGDRVVVVATVHAQDQELASGMRLEKLSENPDAPTVRVRYPAGVRTIRYRAPHERGEGVALDFFSSSTADYDGQTYRIAPGHGKRVWADLEVRVPARLERASFRNLAGLIDAEGVEGTLAFDVASADLDLRRLSGSLTLEGSSGDVRAQTIRGSWTSHFSSGDCRLEGFEGSSISWKTSSGDVHARSVRADRIDVDTSSGDVSLRGADVEEFAGESSSGDLRVDVEGSRLRALRAHTSSGDVTLRLPPDASFDAAADQSSGDMRVGFSDGSSTLRHDKLVAYRRGSGAARIRLETSSGDVSILPN